MPGMVSLVKRACSIDPLAVQANSFADHGGGTFDINVNVGRYGRSNPTSVWHYPLRGSRVFKKRRVVQIP